MSDDTEIWSEPTEEGAEGAAAASGTRYDFYFYFSVFFRL